MIMSKEKGERYLNLNLKLDVIKKLKKSSTPSMDYLIYSKNKPFCNDKIWQNNITALVFYNFLHQHLM